MNRALFDKLTLNMLVSGAGVVAASSPAHALDTLAVTEQAFFVMDATWSTVKFGYAAAPALMLGLALALAFVVLAMVMRASRVLTRPHDATRRYRSRRGHDVSGTIDGEAHNHTPLAFIEVEGAQRRRFSMPRDMVRIGREDDNDIRIPSGAVHRYHAAIHREDFDDWHITDLSGIEGNGISVNGQRCSDARLHDGDVIELGPGRLRFRAGFA